MSPEERREHETKCLAYRAVAALGVNGKGDAAHIMEHAIAQANLELGVIENTLEGYVDAGNSDEHLCSIYYLLIGIRARLEMAQHSAPALARILATDSEAANG